MDCYVTLNSGEGSFLGWDRSMTIAALANGQKYISFPSSSSPTSIRFFRLTKLFMFISYLLNPLMKLSMSSILYTNFLCFLKYFFKISISFLKFYCELSKKIKLQYSGKLSSRIFLRETSAFLR
jgi:hypothetical protein